MTSQRGSTIAPQRILGDKVIGRLERVVFVRVGMAAVLGACLVFAASRLITQISSGLLTPWWGNALGAVATASLWLWFERNPLHRANLAVQITAGVALFSLLIPLPYGFGSTIWWLSLISFATALMGKRREAIVWAFVVMSVVITATLLEPKIQIPGAIGESASEAALARILFAAVLLAVAFSFRNLVERRGREIVEARKQAERSSEAKTRFLSHMSHELRTPLNGVTAMIDLALRSEVKPEVKNYLRTASGSASLLLRLIQNVLDAARFEEGTTELVLVPFSLHKCLSEALIPLGARAVEKGLGFTAQASPGLPEHRVGDSTRLAEIVVNLVGNAIKFTEEGEIEVNLKRGGNDDQILLLVRDTGCGIPPERLQDIFEPFVQVFPSKQDRNQGTGLGLAITNEIVRLMGGTVRVESRVGEGSEFRVILPLPVHDEQKLHHGPSDLLAFRNLVSPEVALESDIENLRVLVVDDNNINRLVASHMLLALGHEAVLAEDAPTGLDLMATDSFDILLIDLEMPKIDGLEMTRRIRSREKIGNFAPVPILAVSAHVDAHWVERALEVGMDGYLAKPLHLADLSRSLIEVTANRTPRAASRLSQEE